MSEQIVLLIKVTATGDRLQPNKIYTTAGPMSIEWANRYIAGEFSRNDPGNSFSESYHYATKGAHLVKANLLGEEHISQEPVTFDENDTEVKRGRKKIEA